MKPGPLLSLDKLVVRMRIRGHEDKGTGCFSRGRKLVKTQKRPARPSYALVSAGGLEPSWKRVIEAMPDRFTAGIDDVFSEGEYLHVVKAIREGLLAKLSPETAKKVAYENTDRLFGISK
jgi:hypothetical protein